MIEQNTTQLHNAVIESLREVIDPETNVDVMRMRLIENLNVDEAGHVRYTFRPSSELCPIAVFLTMRIKHAVAQVPGVSGQTISVEGYVGAEDLTNLINQEI
jgi:metal-sulfur cluster biosynthetic enzyme